MARFSAVSSPCHGSYSLLGWLRGRLPYPRKTRMVQLFSSVDAHHNVLWRWSNTHGRVESIEYAPGLNDIFAPPLMHCLPRRALWFVTSASANATLNAPRDMDADTQKRFSAVAAAKIRRQSVDKSRESEHFEVLGAIACQVLCSGGRGEPALQVRPQQVFGERHEIHAWWHINSLVQ
jgi:hypothetical protein